MDETQSSESRDDSQSVVVDREAPTRMMTIRVTTKELNKVADDARSHSISVNNYVRSCLGLSPSVPLGQKVKGRRAGQAASTPTNSQPEQALDQSRERERPVVEQETVS